jgi:hypothetical protein
MNRTDAMAWVVSICTDSLRKSQVTTLSVLVSGALSAMRLSLAGIGRELAAWDDGSAKHAIKRVYRFLRNQRVEPVEVMPAVMNRLLRRQLKWHGRKPERRPLWVSLDWSKVRVCHVLAAVVVEGRALPLCWESYKDKVAGKSQNALEEAMLAQLKATLPAEVRIVILADRGFGRASLIATCQRLDLAYLIRIPAKVHVRTERWSGVLCHYAIRRGQCHGFKDVSYRSDGVVNTNLIVRWKTGLASDKDHPWYLATSLTPGRKADNERTSDMYALRFDIEELFRDAKNEHLGWSLAKTRVSRADRLDRLILIGALAYVLLMGLGLWCREHLDPRKWCTNKRKKELSAFAIGKVMIQRVTTRWRQVIDLLLDAIPKPGGNWG